MPLNIRFDGDLAILCNIARLMDDPRHFDAGVAVDEVLDDGYRAFVVELREVGSLGPSGLGLLTTLTRRVRQSGGELVLAGVRKGLNEYLETMRMDTYWEVFAGVDEAKGYYLRHPYARESV